jgi:hypothetical protein
MTDPTCGYGQCTTPAKWVGVSPSTLAADETYPTYACDEHVAGLVAIRDLAGNYAAGDAAVLAGIEEATP